MKRYYNPSKSEWKQICSRPAIDFSSLEQKVNAIIKKVLEEGDFALRELSAKYDGYSAGSFLCSEEEISAADERINDDLKNSILLAKKNIEAFHRVQVEEKKIVDPHPGLSCWRKSVAIEKVGLYIPGGTAPLFSTILMLGIPAKIAGCREIVLCTPASATGNVHPAILYTAGILGIKKIFKIGGAQAIAAMAYGTETVPAVYKIFGPGNQYVTAAKQLVQKAGLAIDMPAGPSELAILADRNSNAAFIAADLLSQAEHGIDSQVLLVSTDLSLFDAVEEQIDRQLRLLSRSDIAAAALKNSAMVLVETEEEAMEFLNEYAPEHLIICSDNAAQLAEQVINAGSVFLGQYCPEAAGDYASGTNHTLPTNGFAKAYSGVSVDSFVKKISFQQMSREGLEIIGPSIERMAEAEGLDAHKNAVRIRLQPGT